MIVVTDSTGGADRSPEFCSEVGQTFCNARSARNTGQEFPAIPQLRFKKRAGPFGRFTEQCDVDRQSVPRIFGTI